MKKQRDYIESCWNEIEKSKTGNKKTSKNKMTSQRHVAEPEDDEVSGLERFLLGIGLMCLLFIIIYITS